MSWKIPSKNSLPATAVRYGSLSFDVKRSATKNIARARARKEASREAQAGTKARPAEKYRYYSNTMPSGGAVRTRSGPEGHGRPTG